GEAHEWLSCPRRVPVGFVGAEGKQRFTPVIKLALRFGKSAYRRDQILACSDSNTSASPCAAASKIVAAARSAESDTKGNEAPRLNQANSARCLPLNSA